MQETVDWFFAEFFRRYPVNATDAGNHEHDGRWPDLTDAGRVDRLAFLAEARARLEGLDTATLSRDDAFDRRILLDEIDNLRFNEEELDELHWNPIAYTYIFGSGLFSLLSREFAPLPDRLRSATERMRALPAAIEEARGNLSGGDASMRRSAARSAPPRTRPRTRSMPSSPGCATSCCQPRTATSAWGATCTGAS